MGLEKLNQQKMTVKDSNLWSLSGQHHVQWTCLKPDSANCASSVKWKRERDLDPRTLVFANANDFQDRLFQPDSHTPPCKICAVLSCCHWLDSSIDIQVARTSRHLNTKWQARWGSNPQYPFDWTSG
jgi:hypothetical protein